MSCDPSLRDEIVSILSPHADNCQDVDCEWCDGAIYRADLIAKAVVEHLARPFDDLGKKARESGLPVEQMDIDASLAWDTAARLIRGHGVER